MKKWMKNELIVNIKFRKIINNRKKYILDLRSSINNDTPKKIIKYNTEEGIAVNKYIYACQKIK